MRELIEEFEADRRTLAPLYPAEFSASRHARLKRLHEDWLGVLAKESFAQLSTVNKIEFVLFRRFLEHEIRTGEIRQTRVEKAKQLAPFAEKLFALEEELRRMDFQEPSEAADKLSAIMREIEASRACLIDADKPEKHVAALAVRIVRSAGECLNRWQGFFSGYDPMFDWWLKQPYQGCTEALEKFAEFLCKELVGIDPTEDPTTVGEPVGRERIEQELCHECIAYTPEELIEIGEREYTWCESEMLRASAELGFGEDWRTALEHVKGMHVEPGMQPKMVRDLAREAIRFLEERDLLTIPDLAKEGLTMEMMPAEKQKINPFFLGGPKIIVSFPTSGMTHEEKRMAMRGNSAPMSRATVQHELIPGHFIQWFFNARRRPYRDLFWSPFWVEGWTLYWEMLLWDIGFPRTPEERIGMLFWRMHRCVRIVFSLRFHLGEMDATSCVSMLVDRVGHERATAEGEVRRSFGGDYSPIYQLAYMIGGLMFRAMRNEVVGTGKMSLREFHDAIMQENNIPPYMLRKILLDMEISAEQSADWKFAG